MDAPTPTTCEGCHATKSPHKTRFAALRLACEDCHRASWRASGFVHAQYTKFPLGRDHQMAQCRDCHRGGVKGDLAPIQPGHATCGGCHRHPAGVVHDGKYTSTKCTQCHLTAYYPGPRFLAQIHGPPGSFPLVGGHQILPCTDCHQQRTARGKVSFENTPRECSTCHPDPHAGRRGPTCSGCHVSGTWTPILKSPP